ncbi:hypothetical protein [Pontixanthobacter sp.]|uniref:hypothetical protein n=1 Tax=Pontixanthobacter sp. TaxID=2792078 RepID=UPI003C7ADB28
MSTHPDPRSFDRADASSAPITPETFDQTSRGTLPATQQHNSWTPARQAAFLRELSATHNVAAAARAVGMSRQSAYQLRAKLRGEPFDAAWEAAFVTRFDVLAEAALDRALNGVEVPHYYNGELVGTSRRYDERLTLSLLSMRRTLARPEPKEYEGASAFAADDMAGLIDRVEHGPEEWHLDPEKEWELRFRTETEESAEEVMDENAADDAAKESAEKSTEAGGPPSASPIEDTED